MADYTGCSDEELIVRLREKEAAPYGSKEETQGTFMPYGSKEEIQDKILSK